MYICNCAFLHGLIGCCSDGLRELFHPRLADLQSPRLWLVGFGSTCQLFGLGQGLAMELASRNNFDQSHLARDVLIIVIVSLLGTLLSCTIGRTIN